MKKSVLIILFIAASALLRAQVFTSANKELSQVATIKDASGWIRFHENVAVDAAGFFAAYGKAFKLGANDKMINTRIQTDKLGYTHARYQQQYDGVPVMGAEYFIHSRNGKAVTGNGKLITGLNINTNPQLSSAQALQAATGFVGARKYMWETAANEAMLKHITGKADATYYPRAELVIVDSKFTSAASNYRLAWKINVYAEQPLSYQDIYVDAQTGGIIHVMNRLCTGNVQGTAHTKYSGVRTITTDSTGPGQYRLRESATGNGIETYNMKKSTDYGTAVDFTDTDNDWNNINAQKDEVATDAHWGAQMTYDYYLTVHGRHSYDDSSAKLVSFVHYDVNYSNAFWDGNRMTYGDGDGLQEGPLTAVDVCGHEITHGVTQHTAGLVYQNESGALNESFSDMLGTSVEFYALNGAGNWLIGEAFDLQNSTGFRDMSNPKANQNPDTYKGQYWYAGPADNGGVHNNSGVANYWFYLLSHGGSGTNDHNSFYVVTGVGIDTAARIAYRALSVYMGTNSQYIDALEATLQAASDLYGPCSRAFIQCANAWYAVGLGTAVADLDFSMLDAASPASGCGLTHEAVSVRATYNGCSIPVLAGDTVRFFYSVDGKPAVEDTLVLSVNVNARDTISFTFDSLADVSSTGMHNLKVWIAYAGDTLAYNDTLVNYTFENKVFQNVDVGVTKIVKPVSGCTLSSAEPVTVQVEFFGCDFLPAGTKVPVDYTVNGGVAVVDTLDVSAHLYPGMPVDFTFTQRTNLSASQTHTLSAGTNFTPDIYTSNDRVNNYKVKKPLVVTDTTLTFEGNQANSSFLTHTTAYSRINLSISARKSGTFGLLMTGGNPFDYLSLIQFPSGNDTWKINEFLSAKVDFCVNASLWDSVHMNFDLKQTCGQDLYTLYLGPRDYTVASSLRVLVNDTIMIGDTYNPSTGSSDPFVNRHVDLSPYAGTFFTLSFETRNIAKDSLGFRLDNAYIDNVSFNPNNTIGVHEYTSMQEVTTYPNPSDGRFWIECSSGRAGASSLEIVDYTGRIVSSKTYDLISGHNRIPVDIGQQAAGIYVVHITISGVSYTGRVICK